MNEYYPYPKRDPIKNYFPLPNELFLLGLTAGEIAIYAFLMRWENRKDYSCVESYQEIGDAVSMSRNTVSKYVAMLEERGLIRTEHTSIITRAGQKGNGKLRYKILPIQEAVDYYHEQQLLRLEADVERQRVQAQLSRLCAPQESLPVEGRPATPPAPQNGVSGLCGPACEMDVLSDMNNDQVNWVVENRAAG